MARSETNDRKREEMQSLIAGLLQAGWTVAELKAIEGLSSSTFSSYKNGKSMGTNHQRETLARYLHGDKLSCAQKALTYHQSEVLRYQKDFPHRQDLIDASIRRVTGIAAAFALL